MAKNVSRSSKKRRIGSRSGSYPENVGGLVISSSKSSSSLSSSGSGSLGSSNKLLRCRFLANQSTFLLAFRRITDGGRIGTTLEYSLPFI